MKKSLKIAILAMALASPAFAQEATPGNPENPASLQVRLSQYDEQIRKLNGEIEELRHANQQLQEKLDKSNADNDFRLKALEVKTTPAAIAPEIPTKEKPTPGGGKEKILGTMKVDKNAPPAAPPAPKSPEQKAKDQYDTAFDLLRQQKYDDAVAAFEKFANENSQSPMASGAYYWMGESYFVQKDYENAAKKFVTGYKKFPKGQKAPETLLKLGDSLAALNKKKDACITYDKLANEFPKAGSAVKKRLAESRAKLHCQ